MPDFGKSPGLEILGTKPDLLDRQAVEAVEAVPPDPSRSADLSDKQQPGVPCFYTNRPICNKEQSKKVGVGGYVDAGTATAATPNTNAVSPN